MIKENMSIHRALAELKMIEVKINRELSTARFAGSKSKKSEKVLGVDVDKFKKQSKAGFDKITDLIKRRNAIKSAIIASNAVTKVEVAGKTMTVAEAIDRKNSIELERDLLNRLANTVRSVHEQVHSTNTRLETEALEYFKDFSSDKTKVTDQAFRTLVNAYKEERETEVIEGFDVRDEVVKLAENIEEFVTNVDFVLSDSNAITKIEVEY